MTFQGFQQYLMINMIITSKICFIVKIQFSMRIMMFSQETKKLEKIQKKNIKIQMQLCLWEIKNKVNKYILSLKLLFKIYEEISDSKKFRSLFLLAG